LGGGKEKRPTYLGGKGGKKTQVRIPAKRGSSLIPGRSRRKGVGGDIEGKEESEELPFQ